MFNGEDGIARPAQPHPRQTNHRDGSQSNSPVFRGLHKPVDTIGPLAGILTAIIAVGVVEDDLVPARRQIDIDLTSGTGFFGAHGGRRAIPEDIDLFLAGNGLEIEPAFAFDRGQAL